MSLSFSMRGAALLGALVVGLCADGAPARAATFVVNSTEDFEGTACSVEGAPCTLRGAITAANADKDFDAIVFDPTVFASKQTITISNFSYPRASDRGLPDINTNMSITGPDTPGAGVTIRALDAQRDNLIRINGGYDKTTNVSFSNLTFTGAESALSAFGSNTTLTGCTLVGNQFGISNIREHWVIPDERDFSKPGIVKEDLGTLTLHNCTICNNSDTAITNGAGSTVMNSCTITGNGTGICIDAGSVAVSNTIAAGNKIHNLDRNKSSIFSEDKHSLIGGTAKAAGLDPRGLQDNGGPTPTVALVAGSPAFKTGNTSLPTDQRGRPRSPKGSDVGAFESQPATANPATESELQKPTK